jgi:DNA mismatch endonuclease (patch repair protein)
MADRLTKTQRSRNMSRIRGTNTRPEKIVRSGLHRAGFRFRLHGRGLPGRPDIVLKRYRAVVACRGCFWHHHSGCRFATLPKTRAAFWRSKLTGNQQRDAEQVRQLAAAGWRVLVIWECALRQQRSRDSAIARAASWLRGNSEYAEILPEISGSDQS